MSVATSFASAAPKAPVPPSSWRETITGSRYTVVARAYYDICLEARAVREAGAAGFDVLIVLLRVIAADYNLGAYRWEGSFPKEFRRAGAMSGEKVHPLVVLCEIKLKEGLSKQEAECEVAELAQKLREKDGGYADSLVEEMGYKEAIERTKPNYDHLRIERL